MPLTILVERGRAPERSGQRGAVADREGREAKLPAKMRAIGAMVFLAIWGAVAKRRI